MIFCAYLRWLPFPTYVSFTSDPMLWAQNLLLPWTVVVLVSSSTYARLSRNGMVETLSEDHIRTARAYGLSERRVMVVHAARGALTPMITVAAIDLGGALTSAVLTESTSVWICRSWLALCW
jgi:peptide/nickel transport system permease protein